MGFRSPLTAAQIAAILGGVVPTAAQNAAATDAATNSVAAATQSAVARIRSMTRVSFFMNNSVDSVITVPISVTDINRCQVHLLGSRVDTGSFSPLPGISAVSNTGVELTRYSSVGNAQGFIEVMEWI